MSELSKKARLTSWIFQIVVIAILGQTLFFKFTGAEESKAIFEALGAEPWGRFGTGIAELIAIALLLRSRTAVLGSVLAMGLMGGAIGSHLFKLGIEVQGDGGTLFVLAVVTFVAAGIVTLVRRADLPLVGSRSAADPA